MLARAERKRSRHDAPGTERKVQAQGRELKYTNMTVLVRSARRVCADMRIGCTADLRQVPEGNPFVCSRFTKTTGLRKARSLFLQRGRCSPGAREAVRRGAPVLHQLQPTWPPPGSWSGRSEAEAGGAGGHRAEGAVRNGMKRSVMQWRIWPGAG